MLVVNKSASYVASKKQLESLSKLIKLGLSETVAAAALVKYKFNIDDAFRAAKVERKEEKLCLVILCWI